MFRFLNIIISEKEPSMKKVAESRAGNSFRQLQPLTQEHEYALIKLFEQEIDLARQVDSICKDISSKSDCNIYQIFCNFDTQRLNYLTLDWYLILFIMIFSIENFVIKNGFYPSESDIKAIFRRLDIDKDGRVSFDEFKKIVSYQDYSNITGLQNEELNPNLQSYNNFSKSYCDNYLPSNNRLTSNDLDYKNSHSSMKNIGKKERVDYQSFNAKVSGNNKGYEENRKDFNNININFQRDQVGETHYSVANSIEKTNTLEREINKASSNTSTLKSQSKNNKSYASFGGNTSSFINRDYILLEEEAFQEMLRDIIEMNKEIELLKCDLAICNDFNLLDSFRYFQSSTRDFLYASDLKNGLHVLEIPFSDEEVEFFINRFDTNKIRVIS